jgi:hypothetical protein
MKSCLEPFVNKSGSEQFFSRLYIRKKGKDKGAIND